MRGHDELRRALQPYLEECEPTTDRRAASRARLEAHITENATKGAEMAEPTASGSRLRRAAPVPRRMVRRLSRSLAQLVAGLVVFIALLPTSGAATIPSHCSAALGYTVPCGPWIALIAGTAAAGLIRLLINRH